MSGAEDGEAGSSAIRELLGRGSIYTTSLALQAGATIVVLPALTRLLDPAQLGVVAAALVVYQILTIIAGVGIPAAITLIYFDDETGSRSARALVLVSAAAAIIVGAIAELTAGLWTSVFSEIQFDRALRLAVWGGVFAAVMTAAQGVLRAEDRAWSFTATTLLAAVGGQVAGVLALVHVEASPANYMAGLAGASAASALIGNGLARPIAALRRLEARTSAIRRALQIGGPTIPHGLALYILAAGDRIIVERAVGADALGRYQVAYTLGAVGLMVLVAANNAWGPIIYRSEPGRQWEVLAETSDFLGRLTALGTVALAMLAPLGLKILAPGEYEPEQLVPVVAIVALATLPYVTYLSSVHVLFVRGRTSTLAWASPFAAVVNLALNAVAVPRLGLLGAALATTVSYTLLAGIIRRRSKTLAVLPQPVSNQVTIWVLTVVGVICAAAIPSAGAWLATRGAAALALTVIGFFGLRRAGASFRLSPPSSP